MDFLDSFTLSMDPSIDVLPAPGMIQTGYLRGLNYLVSTLGGDMFQVLEDNGINPLAFANPGHQIECNAAVNLLEYCSRRLDAPFLGMQLAELQEPDAFGCVTALARAAPTMRQALRSLVNFVPVSTSPECGLELVMSQDVAEFRWWTDTRFGCAEQLHYQGLLLFMKTIQMLGRQHFTPLYVNINFPIASSSIQALQERIGCKINTKSDINAIAFPVEILDLPISTSNKLLFTLLECYLTEVRSARWSSFTEKVEAYVRTTIPKGRCSVGGCADKLAISVRALQERLTRSGARFSDILQNERIKLAKHALLWSDLSLDEIALGLGYSEQTSFGRAFKRCTGMTPRAFRLAK